MNSGKILLVEDDPDLREALDETLKLAGYETIVAEDGESGLANYNQYMPDIVISDINMDGMNGHDLLRSIRKKNINIPVILITAHSTVDDAVLAMREGAVDYLTKPFLPQTLVEKIQSFSIKDNKCFKPVAEDPKSKELLDLAAKVAASDATVLITGESGTGKEVLARYIHDHSNRKDNAFVAINCAAIPENMLEAMLFGYEKGAFTGAHQSMAGKFEQAQNGTLLLDEISEMDFNLQAKILRVLQEKEIERLGSKKTINLDVRVVATSNRLMEQEVKDGKFREDLYYRLNVFPLKWIPLCERKKDILPLVNYIIKKTLNGSNKAIPILTNKAISKLENYNWPGNAREVDNVVQRALILQQGDSIDEDDIHLENVKDVSIEVESVLSKNDLKSKEKEIILTALKSYQGNRTKVAESLGISPRTLRYKLAKIKEQGIELP